MNKVKVNFSSCIIINLLQDMEDYLKTFKQLKDSNSISERNLFSQFQKWKSGDLNSALLNGRGEVLRELVDCLCGYDKSLCNRLLSSLLLDACFSGDLPLVRFLALEIKCWSLHHSAYVYGDTFYRPVLSLDAFKTFSPFDETDEVFDLGLAALLLACQEGHLELIHFLLIEAGVNPAVVISPLLAVCKKGRHLAVVKCLAEANIKPDAIDKYGFTQLHCACMYGLVDVVEYLLTEVGAYRTKTDNEGSTPLHLASKNGHLDLVNYLVSKAHVNPRATDWHGSTSLHLACKNGHLAVVKYLIDKSPNGGNKYGSTPLHFACANGHLDVVKHYEKLKVS